MAVVKDGKVLLARGYGVRRLGNAAPVDGQTVDRFKMAAVSPLADFSFDYQDLEFVPAGRP
jgi:CubicO group peptidase (beta-lactamase class C family)